MLLESLQTQSQYDRNYPHAWRHTISSSNDRLDRLEALLERFISASDERMTRFDQGLERVELVVASNNKFLEAFSTDLRRYTETLNNFATRIDGMVATNNQDWQESNSPLALIQRQVIAIAKHIGVV